MNAAEVKSRCDQMRADIQLAKEASAALLARSRERLMPGHEWEHGIATITKGLDEMAADVEAIAAIVGEPDLEPAPAAAKSAKKRAPRKRR